MNTSNRLGLLSESFLIQKAKSHVILANKHLWDHFGRKATEQYDVSYVIHHSRYLISECNQLSTIMTQYFFEHKKVINDCFRNKPLIFQMQKNNVNFEATALKTLTQRNCIRKRWLFVHCGSFGFKY